MNKRKEFEARLSAIARAPVSFASGQFLRQPDEDWSSIEADISENDILEELHRAEERLKKNPSLFCGDPDGIFTYDDPVLAIAAYLDQANSMIASVVGIAGIEGEDLRNTAFWSWTKAAIYAWRSRGDSTYTMLAGRTPTAPIIVNNEVVRIAVVGDAGYRGQAQSNVLNSIRECHRVAPFDLLIHLGDVYFAGSGDEMLANFLGPFRSVGPKVLTLVGNHDLYFGADAFSEALNVLRQPGRYFCVENPHWRVACLDTALAAEHLLRNTGLLDKGQILWLDGLLETGDHKKTILMSHHYIVSGWEKKNSAGLRRQLGARLGKIFAWYWGHEHGCATYGKNVDGFYGACIGNGAFLELWSAPNRQPLPDWYAKGRCSCYDDRAKFWSHGYLELELQPTMIVERYHLEGGESHTRTLDGA